MRIFFDVSGTVLGSLDASPRPGIHELIGRLRDMGHEVCFWTGGDVEEMGSLLRKAGLTGTVYPKLGMVFLEEPPDVCIDDTDVNLMRGRTVKVNIHYSRLESAEPIEIADIIKAGGCKL